MGNKLIKKNNQSIIETDNIGKNVKISEFCVIRKKVKIGDNVIIHPHVVIENNVIIGNNVEIFPGTYIGKIPKGAGATAKTIRFKKNLKISKDCMVGPNAILYYGISIGKNTLIGDGASIREESNIGSFCIIGRYVTINYSTEIGNRVKIMDHTWLAGKMKIEDNVFISGGVMTSNDNNTDNLIGDKYVFKESEVVGPTIRKSAVIGVGATLLPGIVVGKNSVVAAGAVVTKDVPPNYLVMGVPARIIRDLRKTKKLKISKKVSIKNCRWIRLPKIVDPRGNLTVIENERHIPFAIKRIFYIYEVPHDALRAGHALKSCNQILIALSGRFDVMVSDGTDKKIYHLNRSHKALLIPSTVWREMFNFSKAAVCLVLASEYYDPDDYYRDYRLYIEDLDKLKY